MSPKQNLKSITPHAIRQHITLVFLAPFGAALFALVAAYDFFYLQQEFIALLPALLSLAFLGVYIHYRLTQDLEKGAMIVAIISTIIMFVFIYWNQNSSFGLVWALLYPPLMIMILGHNLGVRVSVVAYVALVAMLFDGIGVWQNGQWDMTSLIRFSLGFIAMTYLSYILALGNHFSYDLLAEKHRSQLDKHKQIEKLALTDSLTGTYNRYSLNQDFKNLPIFEFKDSKTNLVFFITQINFFKDYVDEYGFEAGDNLLIKISQVIENQMKPVNGKVYRITGSQFAGVITARDITKPLMFINEIKELVASARLKHQNNPRGFVSVSIGITIDNHFDNIKLARLMKKADEALYKSIEIQSREPIILDTRETNQPSSPKVSKLVANS